MRLDDGYQQHWEISLEINRSAMQAKGRWHDRQ
jgi:hypothetical protein